MWASFFKKHQLSKGQQRNFLRWIDGISDDELPQYIDDYLDIHYMVMGRNRLVRLLTRRYHDEAFSKDAVSPLYDHRVTRQSVTNTLIQVTLMSATIPKEEVKAFIFRTSPRGIEQEKIRQAEERIKQQNIEIGHLEAQLKLERKHEQKPSRSRSTISNPHATYAPARKRSSDAKSHSDSSHTAKAHDKKRARHSEESNPQNDPSDSKSM